MSKLENSIGWCDDTGNKVIGCAKVSAGCKNCYAEVGTIARVLRSRAVNPIETWGARGTRIAVADFTAKLKRLNKLCICDRCHETQPFARVGQPCGVCPPGTILADHECTGPLRRIRLFADSNSDWLDEAWELDTLAEFIVEIYNAPNVDVLLLTKRPENFHPRLGDIWRSRPIGDLAKVVAMCWSNGKPAGEWDMPKNVWLGVSVENQAMAWQRIPQLLEMNAAIRFLSCEPLLEPVDLELQHGCRGCNHPGNILMHWNEHGRCSTCDGTGQEPSGIDWVIVGGESGKDRRDCDPLAIAWVAAQCQAAGVPVYVKQDCAFKSGQQGRLADAVWRIKQFPEK